jgi:hypothetical protein
MVVSERLVWRITTMRHGFRYGRLVAVALTGVGAASTLAGPTYLYESGGVSMSYDGDLTAGTLTMSAEAGTPFYFHWMGYQSGAGTIGDDEASFEITLDLVAFHDPPDGDDWAEFQGTMSVKDEMGCTMSCGDVSFYLVDPGPFEPGWECHGSIGNMCYDGTNPATFQYVDAACIGGSGGMYMFSFAMFGMDLQDYLANGGAGDDPVPLDLFEIWNHSEQPIGDFNQNGETDLCDLGMLLAAYEVCGMCDLDGDDDTDLADLGILLAHYGETCY